MRLFFLLLTLVTSLTFNSSVLAGDLASITSQAKAQPDLVGIIGKSALLEAPHNNWYQKSHSEYKPNDASIGALSTTINKFQITIFMGTWCHDSQREVPRFYKILELSNYDLNKLNLVALTPSKTTPDELEKNLDIKRTPTFIIFKEGIEVGRIVETPQISLEEDILKIVNQALNP